MNPETVKTLALTLAQTREIELNCSSTFELLDEYAEMVTQGKDVSQLYPLVEHHLETCPSCREEYEALLEILEVLPP